ncbi:hypothetical protein P8X24_01200 [Pyrococcus kukulkanii]|uniref:hypothetical protein n=1 Tax=Pyrococcus kukulkanii TaxID=1609559 RepID=UPI003562D7C9
MELLLESLKRILFSIVGKGLIIASSVLLAPFLISFALWKQNKITLGILLAVLVEFIWASVSYLLGYVQYSRMYIEAAVIGAFFVLMLLILGKQKIGNTI